MKRQYNKRDGYPRVFSIRNPPKNISDWLLIHGGRNIDDLMLDSENGKLYILLSNGWGGYNKKYLPEELNTN